MDLRTMNAITDQKIVGTQIMTELKRKWPETRFEFSDDQREIAAWDEGKSMWMAICAISNMGDWTPAKHLLQYVDGDHLADQRKYPKAA